jgi:hypothetical protein
MSFSAIFYYVDLTLLLLLSGVMIQRKLYRQFPLFFSYICAAICSELIRFSVHQFYFRRVPYVFAPYFYTYWITEAVYVLLGFLVLYEVFLVHMFPSFNVLMFYRWLIPLITVIVVTMTVWTLVKAPSKGPERITVVVGQFTQALNFCQVAFLIFFGALVWFMSREWTRHDLGITTGFGLNAAVQLLVASHWVQGAYSPTKDRIFQLPTISYLAAILIWLWSLSKSDPEPELPDITDETVAETQRAADGITHLVRRLRNKL